ARFDGWEPFVLNAAPAPGQASRAAPSASGGPLSLPGEILADPEAVELCRIWTAQDRQFILLNPRALPEPAGWGILAVDLMRHVGHAFHQLDGREMGEAYSHVLSGLMAEM